MSGPIRSAEERAIEAAMQRQRIEDELRARVGGLRFGLERPREVDYAAWVEEVLDSPEFRFGGFERGVDRAESWIKAGFPEPPPWFRKRA